MEFPIEFKIIKRGRQGHETRQGVPSGLESTVREHFEHVTGATGRFIPGVKVMVVIVVP